MPAATNLKFCSLALLMLAAILAATAVFGPVRAQEPDGVNVPGFWDPNRRFTKPDRTKVRAIRFLTEQESPPFSFTGPDGLPAGFNVDIARAVCEELDIPCTIQELKWDLLTAAIEEGRGDAIIAPVPITAENREKYLFTHPYLGRPARFVATKKSRLQIISNATLADTKVGVVEGSPHARFIETYFPQTERVPFEDHAALRAALQGGALEVVFTDALSASVWLNSQSAQKCCIFVGEAYTDLGFFGEGIAVAVDPQRKELRDAIDFAMSRIYFNGRYFEIFLRYFPRGYY
ncbi:transporter substrate-binding domain-containing protein [Tepidamorphus sp. 3E244]|uniref:transporter substrate-binding domain-containing protein n=1 Tax=Tepidamorphus sp. 3E244 TaxID=3385498 RepID=UPI0038FD2BA4